MADYSTTANVVLTVNGNQAKKMLADLEAQAKDLDEKFKQAKLNGDTKEAQKLERALKRIKAEMDQITTATKTVGDVLKNLDSSSLNELNKAAGSLKRQLKKLKPDDAGFKEKAEQLRAINERIKEVNSSLKESQSTWQKFTGWVNNAKAVILGIVGSLAGFIATAKKAVDAFAGMEQEMANVRKYTGMTSDEVERLNEEFKKMDTRTSREELNKLAQEAGRLGKTSVEDVLGFVRAADQVNVALDDLGEGATLTLSKLTGIFGDEERLGTEKALLSVGSVINELSQNCKASAPYITDFTSRLGGVGAQAGMTVQQIMSFAAVLDSSQAPLEKSATALQQLIMKMLQEPAKYAKAAGLEVKSFTELVKTDMNQALITFLESLSKAGKMDTLAPLLGEMKEKGSGTVAMLATLTDHIQEVKDQQIVANQAFEEGISITNEFNVQNGTVAASLDKSKKSLHELMVELGEKLVPIINLANSSARIGLEVLNTKVGFIKNYGVQIAYLTSIILSYIAATKVADNWTKIWNKTVQFFTSDIKKAGAAVKAFFITLKSNPIGLVVSALTALAGALWLMNDKARQARKEFNEWKKSLTDVSSQVEESTKKEISQLNRLYKAATDETVSREKRIEAANKLQKIYPDVFSNMNTEDILLGRAKRSYDNLTESIKENARAKAAANKIEEIEGQKLDLQIENDDLEEQKERLIKERDQAQKNADFYRKKQEEERFSIFNQYGKWAKAEEEKVDSLNKKIRENLDLQRLNNAKLQESDKAIDSLSKKAGSSGTGNEENEKNEDGTDYTPTLSDKERKAALKKAQQAFKEGLKAIKAEEEKELNELYAKRATGQIDYLQYIEERKSIEAKFYDDSLKFYEDNLKAIKGYNVEDDKDYQSLQLKKTETLQKYENQRISYSAERIKRQSQFEIQELQNEYKWKENKTVADEIALQEQILEIKVKYLQQQQDLYARGTKEWEDLQLQIEKVVEDDRLNHELKIQEAVAEMRKIYGEKTVKEQYEIHKKVLSYLKEQGKITIEEFDKMMEQLDKKLKADSTKEKSSLPGSDYSRSPFEIAKDRKQAFEKDKAELDKALKAGIISLEEYGRMLDQLERKYKKDMLDPLKQCGDTWVAMLSNMYDAWDDFFRSIKNGDWIGSLSSALQTTVSMMSAISSQLTQFTQAELEIQTSAIEKRYDKEIERAEGNNYKIKKLEKQKEDEIAKLKDEASKKNYEMQVIGAIAQTAANAISAYGAGLQVGGLAGLILAPIAAGIATASGLVQVALIKKQQQAAAAQGYSEGGFTPKGPKDKEVGIVHAGEWVASQKLVNNPNTRPMIEALDYAQRTNTIGSISSRDVSRSITAPMVLASGNSQSQPNVIVNVPEAQNDTKALNDTINKLNKRLDDPFVTVNTVAGDNGIKQAQDKYKQLMRNKSPKSKRNS